jgi:hypothetical protein
VKLLFIFTLSIKFLIFPYQITYAENQLEVLYGIDNRFHIEDAPEPNFKLLSLSTAMMIDENKIESAFDGVLTKIFTQTLGEAYYLCSEERYAKDPIAGKCSGFLVGPDILVTAGHCVTSEYSCLHNKWVFDFRNDLILSSGEEGSVYVGSNNVYGCKKVINRSYSSITKSDYTLIQLDRPVLDRKPLKFRTKGKISDDAALVMIGHPLGLSTKISLPAKVLQNDNDFYFKTNLDSFLGNSGSAVFNKKTGLVEGILVRGEIDFVGHEEDNCDVTKVCSQDGEDCQGEDVTRITIIPELVPDMAPPRTDVDPFNHVDISDPTDELETELFTSDDEDEIDWNCYFSDDCLID